MSTPMLVGDLRRKLERIYDDHQLQILDSALAGVGVDMTESKHLEIIPQSDIKEMLETFAKEMSGLDFLPWWLLVNEAAILQSCFSKVNVFGKPMWFISSFYKPYPLEIYITSKGVRTTAKREEGVRNP